MSPFRVSCIVPVYNGERYVGEAIESILCQTLAPLELLVVDDGSTDGTGEVLSRFGNRIRLVRRENGGVSAARNHGIRLARGELVAFLDADDVFLPDKLERQVARFAAVPGLELCAAHIRSFWSADLPVQERDHESVFLEPRPTHLCTWVARRALFERVGGFDEEMPVSQDVDWHLRAREAGAVIETLPEVLALRRFHRGNRTRYARDACREAVVRGVKAFLDRRRGLDG